MYELNLARFFTTLRLAWQVALNKTKLKLKLLTDIDMLLMIEKGIKRRTCHVIHRYVKASNKCKIDYDIKIKHHHTLSILWMDNVVKVN